MAPNFSFEINLPISQKIGPSQLHYKRLNISEAFDKKKICLLSTVVSNKQREVDNKILSSPPHGILKERVPSMKPA
jgi:hypothetical protein